MQKKEIFMPFPKLLELVHESLKDLGVDNGKDAINKALFSSFNEISKRFEKAIPDAIKDLLSFNNGQKELESVSKSIEFTKESLQNIIQVLMLTLDSFLASINEKRERSMNEALPIFKSIVLNPIIKNGKNVKEILSALA